jgi:hypothetical protein
VGAPEMPNVEGTGGHEEQGKQPTRSDTDRTSERERSTTETDENETYYMDEPPSEETDAYYTNTTGEDTGGREEGQSSIGQEAQPSSGQQPPGYGSGPASTGEEATETGTPERDADREDASDVPEEHGHDVNPGV